MFNSHSFQHGPLWASPANMLRSLPYPTDESRGSEAVTMTFKLTLYSVILFTGSRIEAGITPPCFLCLFDLSKHRCTGSIKITCILLPLPHFICRWDMHRNSSFDSSSLRKGALRRCWCSARGLVPIMPRRRSGGSTSHGSCQGCCSRRSPFRWSGRSSQHPVLRE